MNKVVHVAVGVIIGNDGKILIAKRPSNVHQGGLWEFPGGKVDGSETVTQALARELKEELAINILSSEPLIKIRHDYGDKIVLLDVHKVYEFDGDPVGNEGQPVQWVAPNQLDQFEFPAANRPIITAIKLPQRFLITGAARDKNEIITRVQHSLENGIKLIQLRMQESESDFYWDVAQNLSDVCAAYSAYLQLNSSVDLFLEKNSKRAQVGLHLNSHELRKHSVRPVDKNILLSASCHDASEIACAINLGADFICLSPVDVTLSHPNAAVLGWDAFEHLVESCPVPVFALGGMTEDKLAIALAKGAQGIAAISAWWD